MDGTGWAQESKDEDEGEGREVEGVETRRSNTHWRTRRTLLSQAGRVRLMRRAGEQSVQAGG